MLGSILRFFLVGLLAIVAIGIVLKVVGVVLGISFFLLFTVGPIALVGYVVLRLVRPKHKEISAADRHWLES
jgi:hypothetical protein